VVSSVAESPGSLAVATRTDQSVAILTVDGVLDTSNCAALRDHMLQATLDEPAAVIVNISALKVLAELAWSTFIGAHWQVRSKPNVPIVLVCAHRATREAITRSGVAYFMPVYSTEKAAMKALSQQSRRAVRRADAPLPADLTSLRESRRLASILHTGRPGCGLAADWLVHSVFSGFDMFTRPVSRGVRGFQGLGPFVVVGTGWLGGSGEGCADAVPGVGDRCGPAPGGVDAEPQLSGAAGDAGGNV
jgi:anti-anti-sigma factor